MAWAAQLEAEAEQTDWKGLAIDSKVLHWVKDVVLKEDASRVRTGQAPMTFASFRNALVSCLHASGFSRITDGRRHLTLNFDQAVPFIYHPLE